MERRIFSNTQSDRFPSRRLVTGIIAAALSALLGIGATAHHFRGKVEYIGPDGTQFRLEAEAVPKPKPPP